MAGRWYDSSSEDETVLDDYKGKNGIMFLLDFREEMFDKDLLLGNSYFQLCLDTCKKLMMEVARSGKDDLVSLSLIGTERGTTGGPPSLANIQPLCSVDAAVIKQVDEIIVDHGDALKDKYGRLDKAAGLNLVKILNSSLKLFTECTKKIYTKTLVLMTLDDNPFGQDVRSAHLARKQAKRLSHAAVDLIVVGLGNDFDPNKLYNELIALSRGEFDRNWSKINRVKRLEDLDNLLLSLMSRLSRTNRDLALGKGISIPISLYKLFKEPKVKFKRKVVSRPVDIDLSSDDESNIRPQVNQGSSSAVNVLDSSLSRKDMLPLIGGRVIRLTKGELADAEFHDVGAGLTLIGFVSSRDVPEYLSVVPPRVMLPNYFSPDGIKAFACLLEQCREDDLSMVCWYRYNNYSNITLVVCRPMSQQSDTKGNVCPDGFCIVTLPFSDNYGDPEYVKTEAEPSETQCRAADEIIKKLTVSYSFSMFHDFELQKTLAMVEALALDYDEAPTIIDDTILEDEGTDSRIADFIEDFNNCSHLGPYDSVGPVKRPRSETSFRATKNPKLGTMEGMLDTVREGKTDLLNVSQLKDVLNSQGILYSSSARKKQLVDLANARIK